MNTSNTGTSENGIEEELIRRQVNIYEAKTGLCGIIDAAVLTREEIIIARNGRPAARLAPLVAHVNVYEAKTQLSRLVDLVADGGEVVIGRNGRPVARLLPLPGVGDRPPTQVIASCGHFMIAVATAGDEGGQGPCVTR